jgi:NADH pyrophosphatase NudC (nudix superfamily)
MTTWLLFTYKVPNQPSARRVYVWRKLKGLGAILLHDTAWMLPDTSYAREKLQWLATEVKDMEGGEATLWQAEQVFTGQDIDLQQQFVEQVDASYRKILSELENADADLVALSKQYQQVKRLDYFQSELGNVVRQKLLELRESD